MPDGSATLRNYGLARSEQLEGAELIWTATEKLVSLAGEFTRRKPHPAQVPFDCSYSAIFARHRKRTSEEYWKNPIKWNEHTSLGMHSIRNRLPACVTGLRSLLRRAKREHGHRPRASVHQTLMCLIIRFRHRWRQDLFALIRECRRLDWLMLTKRPQNILKMLPADWGDGYRNVWLGVTAEDQTYFDQPLAYSATNTCRR